MAERFGVDLLLLEKLAAGGMAEVFRARQLGIGGFEKTVAVKRILSSYAANEEFKEMFRQEANLSAQFQHPNIAQIFTNGEHESYLFLVMEFVDGKNVRQLLARSDKKKMQIPIEVSCFIACEAAKGLEYAHRFADEKTGVALDIVHRDMSPQNVMVSYDGAVKVVDFGIAKASARADTTRAGVLKGKFGYMAPEQAMGMKLDKRTDIFALGIILFELLTQRRLFSSDDDLKTLQLVKDCRVPRPSKYNPAVSPTLDRIVLKALAKERHERYESAGELYADLLRFLNQKYPKFIPTDCSNFLRQVFAEEILEEKKRRDKINAEVPAVLASPIKRHAEQKESPKKEPAASENPESTYVDSGDKTEVSIHNMEPVLAAPPEGHHAVEISAISDAPKAMPAAVAPPVEARVPSLEELPTESPALAPQTLRLEVELGDNYLPKATVLPSAPPLPQISSMSRPKGRLMLYGAALLVIGVGVYLKGAQQSSPSPQPPQESIAQVDADVPNNRLPARNNEVSNSPENPLGTLGGENTLPPANVESGESEAPLVTENASDPVADPLPPVETVATSIEEKVVEEERVPSAVPPSSSVVSMPGFLTLDAVPRATEVYINGQLLTDAKGVPLSTPVKRFSLKPGNHEIRLKNSSFGASWKGEVSIKSDRISVKDVVLK